MTASATRDAVPEADPGASPWKAGRWCEPSTVAETLGFQLAHVGSQECDTGNGMDGDWSSRPSARNARETVGAGAPPRVSKREEREPHLEHRPPERRCDASQACKGTRLKPRRKLVDVDRSGPVRVHTRERPGRPRSGPWIEAVLTCLQATRQDATYPAPRSPQVSTCSERQRHRRAGPPTMATSTKARAGARTVKLWRVQPQGRRQLGTQLTGRTGEGAKRTPVVRPKRLSERANPGRAGRRRTKVRSGNASGSGPGHHVGWEPRR